MCPTPHAMPSVPARGATRFGTDRDRCAQPGAQDPIGCAGRDWTAARQGRDWTRAAIGRCDHLDGAA